MTAFSRQEGGEAAEQAAADVQRALAGLPGLRRVVELAEEALTASAWQRDWTDWNYDGP